METSSSCFFFPLTLNIKGTLAFALKEYFNNLLGLEARLFYLLGKWYIKYQILWYYLWYITLSALNGGGGRYPHYSSIRMENIKRPAFFIIMNRQQMNFRPLCYSKLSCEFSRGILKIALGSSLEHTHETAYPRITLWSSWESSLSGGFSSASHFFSDSSKKGIPLYTWITLRLGVYPIKGSCIYQRESKLWVLKAWSSFSLNSGL